MAPYVKAVYLLTNNQTNILSRFMCTANMKIRNDSVVAAPCQRCKRSASFNLPGRQADHLLPPLRPPFIAAPWGARKELLA